MSRQEATEGQQGLNGNFCNGGRHKGGLRGHIHLLSRQAESMWPPPHHSPIPRAWRAAPFPGGCLVSAQVARMASPHTLGNGSVHKCSVVTTILITSSPMFGKICPRLHGQNRSPAPCPTSPRTTCERRLPGAQISALGMARYWIPKYAGMTAGEPKSARLSLANVRCDGEGSRVCFWEDPVLASPSPSPRCNLQSARSPGLNAMRSANLPQAPRCTQTLGPGGSHGHNSTHKKQKT